MKTFNFEEHEKMIKILAKKHSRVFLEFDDLFQEGYIEFRKAEADFDENRGVKFSTYLYFRVNQRMRNLASSSIYKASKKVLFDDTYEKGEAGNSFISELADDCKDVIKIIFETPLELIEGRKITLGSIRRLMRFKGWSHKRVTLTIEEIKDALKTI